MKFEICTGNYEHFGVTKHKDIISFSRQAGEQAICNLLLYPKDGGQVLKIPMKQHKMIKTIYYVGIKGLETEYYDYNFEIDGVEETDPYARRISGRECWAEEKRRPVLYKAETFVPEKIRKIREKEEKTQKKKIKSSFYFSKYSWKEQGFSSIKKEEMVIYKLHARGFSMGMKTENPKKGTFGMVERKLDYLQGLGVTSLLFLPVYEFEEFLLLDESKKEANPGNQVNYWGYTRGNYFALKESYLEPGTTPDAFKRLVYKMHERGMECLLEFYFDEKINPHLIIEVLHFWRMEYHVDGFRLLCSPAAAELAAQDGMLSGSKLFYDGFSEELAGNPNRYGPELYTCNGGFLYQVRRLLNHQGGDIYEFACQMRRQQEHQGFVNYVAENNGFTLWDLFSYAGKHNEENGEDNKDGADWNCSSNSGVEGVSRKREINALRRQKVKNALAVTALAQGVPLIWMGDECANTQNGNNNAYCQDNETGWKDWKNSKISREMTGFLQKVLKLRKEFPVLRSPVPFQMKDYANLGCPDLSYHSDGGWQMDFDRNRGFIGMFYWGGYGKGRPESLYIAYNFQNTPQKFALPQELEWQLVLDTAREDTPQPLSKRQKKTKEFFAAAQSVCVLLGKK